ncbi:hypothetical protein L1887_18102 [Cichorium endivia]|nr:hypothetical protein L1887_18102 [Cichorium endivia]
MDFSKIWTNLNILDNLVGNTAVGLTPLVTSKRENQIVSSVSSKQKQTSVANSSTNWLANPLQRVSESHTSQRNAKPTLGM